LSAGDVGEGEREAGEAEGNEFERMQAGVVQWFPGHMYSASQKIHDMLAEKGIDLVVEVRDARIPLTSSNHILEGLIKDKQRLVVLNKAELADKRQQKTVEELVKKETGAATVMHTNARQEGSVEELLRECMGRIRQSRSRLSANKMMVVGMPNVGKSTLINAFKRTIGKVAGTKRDTLDVGMSKSANSSSALSLSHWAKKNASDGKGLPFTLGDTNDHSDTRVKKKKKKQELAKTGPFPGVTRDVNGFWVSKEDPALVCVDSPGMLLPRLSDGEKMLKLALVGCIRDDLVGEFLIADYLLYKLAEADNNAAIKAYSLPVASLRELDVDALLAHIGKEKALRGDEASVIMHAARHFIGQFRLGNLGRLCLDPLS